MADRNDVRFFISYSRKDQALVRNLTRLVGLSGAYAFLDEVSIEPGDRWQKAIDSAIREASCVIVFWSRHAEKSEWVDTEWRLGLMLGKKLVPVRLDDTALPTQLSQFQAIDLRIAGAERALANKSVYESLLDITDVKEKERLTLRAAQALAHHLDMFLRGS